MGKNLTGNAISKGLIILLAHDPKITITTFDRHRYGICVWPGKTDGYLDLPDKQEKELESLGWVYRRDETEGGSWVLQAKGDV